MRANTTYFNPIGPVRIVSYVHAINGLDLFRRIPHDHGQQYGYLGCLACDLSQGSKASLLRADAVEDVRDVANFFGDRADDIWVVVVKDVGCAQGTQKFMVPR